MQQVRHVVAGEPVLQQRGGLEPELCRHVQHGPPEVVEEAHHQPRARVGYRLQPLEHRLHVRQVVHQIGQEDVIEFLGDGEFSRIGHLEIQFRMALAGQRDHRRAEVHAHAARRFDRRQQIAEAAAHLQHPQSRRHPEGIMLAQQLLVVAAGFPHPKRGPLVVKCTPVNHRAMLVTQKTPAGEFRIMAEILLGLAGRYDRVSPHVSEPT